MIINMLYYVKNIYIYVDVLTTSTSECKLIWKCGHCN